MAPNATAARQDATADFYLDASAVFGALEILAESELDEATDELVAQSTTDARRCLELLGLNREDLFACSAERGVWPGGGEPQRGGPCGQVVPLRRVL